jgi:hypothetical protein
MCGDIGVVMLESHDLIQSTIFVDWAEILMILWFKLELGPAVAY